MNRVMFLLSAVGVGALVATLAGALPTHYERRAARDNGVYHIGCAAMGAGA